MRRSMAEKSRKINRRNHAGNHALGRKAIEKRTGRLGAIMVLLVLVLTAVCLTAGTAMGRGSLSAQELEAYYQEKEQALVAQARVFLDGEGFANSGVMLTRVLDVDGSRVYTLTVHHGKIDRMCEEDRGLLMAELEKMVFEDEACYFKHEFLINQ